MRYLLDTNAWIQYLKHRQGRIRLKVESLDSHEICLCSVVKAELLHGAEKYGVSARRHRLLATLFKPYVSFAFDDEAAAIYGFVRHDLETRGMVIGPSDLMIASICLAHQLICVTANTSEFSRVSGLQVEDWSLA